MYVQKRWQWSVLRRHLSSLKRKKNCSFFSLNISQVKQNLIQINMLLKIETLSFVKMSTKYKMYSQCAV
jgi:hypothetical protein